MSRALLALVIGFSVGNPLIQWLVGVGGSRKAGSELSGSGSASPEAGDLWAPNGTETGGAPEGEGGGLFDPNGSTTEAGSRWDPDG